MIDQLIIGEKASFDDFGASLATRNIGMPTKKSIKETVPFSNVTYDFSKINGELYWEERELEYVFEIIASTPERLEELKTAFASWVMNVHQEEIHDPFIPLHHFVGTFDDIDFEDEESLDKTTVTVTFTAYPYKVANQPTVFEETSSMDTRKRLIVENTSSHRVNAVLSLACATEDEALWDYALIVESNGIIESTITKRGVELANVPLILPVGVSAFSFFCLDAEAGSYTLSVSYTEEVF